MAKQWETIRSVDTSFETAETSDQTVITLETSPAAMPVGWVNFLKQRFDVLGIDYKQVGAGRIVVTSTPRAAESVVRLVVSAIETANDYAKTALSTRSKTKTCRRRCSAGGRSESSSIPVRGPRARGLAARRS